MFDYLTTPSRSSKPREAGITHVVDPGVGIQTVEDRLSMYGDLVDVVKFGWGTGCVYDGVREKVAVYRDHDVRVCFGGTLFELSVEQDCVEEYRESLLDLGVDCVEVSAGVIDLDHDRKCDLVEDLSEEFTVLSEIGRKDPDESIPTGEWVERGQRELDAGAWKVVTEGRTSGSTGVYRADGSVRDGLVDRIAERLDVTDVVFEAPTKEQQAWFVNRLSPAVNVGNVEFDDVVGVETLRRGLRGDTIETVHETAPAASERRLDAVPDGSGCTEIWDHLSAQRTDEQSDR